MNARKTSKTTAGAKPPVSSHGIDHGHDSRVDGSAEYDATHQLEATPWVRPSSLDAPPPREGKTQRWIRKSVHGAADPKNLNRQWREGWRPRPADTLPDDWLVYANFADKNDGTIVVDDLILMEIDTRILDGRRDATEQATRRQMEGVEHDLEKTQIAGHPIVKDHKTSVSHPARRVQPQRVADDD